ncbi:molybdate ABC transporter substrate-binding protein [Thiohalobacter sp. IOR34]|uniref:molybdate ABC transporter substrate-binding protein n=1 Tax=Thiohalobacter sp. IOR34 TaxID=3057176 RepID=UPI0025B146F6|nr:molybdate ABC transporter substrate-binding protein [Thiohalobacter sp. IOR34]WJW76542.1 molybdate ABC transporter substrate-binding protein [Thiohalobacter sp. IOR34]
MMRGRFRLRPLLFCIALLGSAAPRAETLQVAVAANFAAALRALAERFHADSGHQLLLAVGSTGKQYAQIRHGAPFDLFFAADRRRPRLLEEAGLALPGSRFTYAVGRLALWSPDPARVDGEGQVLERGDFRHLAIANPRLAPYGLAASQVLRLRDLWARLLPKLVYGENIAQTFQFVASGNAELGFVAWSQLKRPGVAIPGSWWLVPAVLHSPIEQQAVQLTDSPAAADFLRFVKSRPGRRIIHDFGYATVD